MLARVSDHKLQADYQPLYGPEVLDLLRRETVLSKQLSDELFKVVQPVAEYQRKRAEKAEAERDALRADLADALRAGTVAKEDAEKRAAELENRWKARRAWIYENLGDSVAFRFALDASDENFDAAMGKE